jgi:hypothetical protein
MTKMSISRISGSLTRGIEGGLFAPEQGFVAVEFGPYFL